MTFPDRIKLCSRLGMIGLSLSLLCFLPDIASAQTPADQTETPPGIESPFLWIIESEKPQYLLGTIHVPDKRVLSLHPAIDRVMSEADELYVELNPEDQLSQLKALILPDGQSTSDVLEPEVLARIDTQLSSINANWSHEVLPSFHVWAWPLILPSFMAQQRDPSSPVMDAKLVQLAQERKLAVKSLENPKTQLKEFGALSKEEQNLFLEQTLDDLESQAEKGESSLDQLIDVYLEGDGQELKRLFMEEFETDESNSALNKKVMDAILFKRNELMAKVIADAIEENPKTIHIFAAGTAHFVVGPSVVDLLRKSGLKISRVTP